MATSRTSKRSLKKKRKKTSSLPSIDVLLTEDEIREGVRRLGREITRRYAGKELVLVGVLDGAFLFLADLVRCIDLPLRCDFLRLSSYGDGRSSSGNVRIEFDSRGSITGEHVLLVEDVVDTGRTLRVLLDLLAPRNPKSLRVCSLLHKPDRTEADVSIDFLGFTIPDFFVVGYGMDLAGRHRNLPFVGVVKS